MLFLLGGVLILCGVLLLGYLFVNADPARLARSLKWLGIGAAVALALALVILSEGRFLIFVAPLAALVPALRRFRSMASGMRGGPSSGRRSNVETPFLRMALDHDTGAMTGTVLRGRFAGARGEELSRDNLLELLRECRTADEEAARLLEAYLDRVEPGWRDSFHTRTRSAGGMPPRSGPDMTVEEAYSILGLAPGADEEAIKAAHHRLMKQLHPDHGGSDYFAAKLNRARDVLLRR